MESFLSQIQIGSALALLTFIAKTIYAVKSQFLVLDKTVNMVLETLEEFKHYGEDIAVLKNENGNLKTEIGLLREMGKYREKDSIFRR